MGVKDLIQSILKDGPAPPAVSQFFDLCRRMAAVYLRRQVHAGKLYPDLFPVSIDDLAIDCIADLYATDERGRFYELCTYFEAVSIDAMHEEELLIRLRRLVIAKVNRGIFRSLNEADPSLGKILRNIKLSLQALGSFTLVERFGEPCLVPAMCEALEEAPVIERADLERDFLRASQGGNTIPILLARLSRLLTEQSDHCRIVPLMSVAMLFRSYYSSGQATEGQAVARDEFSAPDAIAILRDACRAVKEEAKRKYVRKGKVDADLLDKYFAVITDNLECTIIENNGQDFSYFDRLKQVVPGLTKEEYFARHRSRLEYLGSLAHKRAIKELKRNL